MLRSRSASWMAERSIYKRLFYTTGGVAGFCSRRDGPSFRPYNQPTPTAKSLSAGFATVLDVVVSRKLHSKPDANVFRLQRCDWDPLAVIVLLVVSGAYDLKCNFGDVPTQQAIVNIAVHGVSRHVCSAYSVQ